MKILKLTFENINSLKGKWQIDFEDPAFYGNAVFAITGDTGAGKTSVLDAICLALYSQTPRVTVSASTNEVMSIGRAQAMSEVVFRVGDKIYRAFWAQHRARKKADGALQPVVRELSELKYKDDESGKILESKPSLVDKLIESVLGMTMVQFTRSVMLVQGDFAAFLKASEHERGAILEQLTGTQIYAQIGKAAYDTHKKHEDAIKTLQMRLGEVRMLSDDDYQSLIQTLSDSQSTQSTLHTQITSLSHAIERTSHYQALSHDVSHWTAKQAEAAEALANFSDDAKRLSAANKARTLTPLYQRYQSCDNEHQQKRTRLADDTLKRKALSDALGQLQAALTEHQDKLNQAEKAHSDAKPLLAEVRALDAKITLDGQALTQREQQHKELLINQQHAQETHQHTSTQLDTAKQALALMSEQMLSDDDYHQMQTHHQTLTRLIDKLELLTKEYLNQHDDIHHLQNQLNKRIGAGRKTGEDYRALAHEITAAEDKLNAKKTALHQLLDLSTDTDAMADDDAISQALQQLATRPHSLEKRQNLFKQLKSLVARKTDTQAKLDALITQKTAAQAQIQAENLTAKQLTDSINSSEAKFKLLQDNYALHSQILHMKAHFDKLQSGDACPLCGATEHPAKNQPKHLDGSQALAVQAQLQSEQAQLDDLKKEQQTLSQSLARLDATLSAADAQCVQTQLALDSINADISHALPELSLSAPPTLDEINAKLSDTALLLEKSTHQYREATQAHSAYHELINQLNERKQDQRQLKNQAETLLAQIRTDYQTLNEHAASLSNRAQSIHALLIDCQAEHGNANEAIHTWQALTADIHEKMNAHLSALSDITTNPKAAADIPAVLDYHEALTQAATAVADALNSQLLKQSERLAAQQKLAKEKTNSENAISALTSSQAEQAKQLSELKRSLANSSAQIEAAQVNLAKLSESRYQLFKDHDTEAHEQSLQAHISQARTALQTLTADAQAQALQKAALDASIDTLSTDIAQLTAALVALASEWQTALKDAALTDTKAYLAACLDDTTHQALNERADTLHTAKKHSAQMLADYTDKLNQLSADDPDAANRNLDEMQGKLTALKDEQAALLQRIGEMNARLKSEQDSREYQADLIAQLHAKQQGATIWEKLNALIGSADGKKYRNFVQGLTLDLVLHHANQILAKMNDRYLLSHDSEQGKALQISITDIHQGDSVRSSANLSGGESFVISLALALALSQINSRQVQIESLFLDEGFGTLDEKALDMALSTLFELQQSGKSIGIISHVASLKERIDTQIIIEKRSGGSSVMRGAGVSALPESGKDSAKG